MGKRKETKLACPNCAGRKVIAKSVGMFCTETYTFTCSTCSGRGYIKIKE